MKSMKSMKAKIILFILYWIVMIYSGDSGRLSYRTKEEPKFVQDGRWLHFLNNYGKDTYVSAGSTVIFFEQND